jgi:hypothetical protein
MRTKRVLLALLVVCCAVSLAGCGMLDSSETGENVETTDTPAVEGTATETTPADQSTTGDDTSEATPTQERTDTPQEQTDQQNETAEDRIPVVGGELGVDQDRVFSQLNALLGTEVSTPQRIIVEETTFTGGGVALDDGLFSMLIDEEAKSLPGYSGTYSGGDVTMVTGDRGATDVEATLAHEYVHHVQAEKRLEAFQGESVRTYEYNVIQQALDEGGAVWVTNEYIDEYMNWTELKTEQISFVESNYDNQFSLNGSEIDSQIDYVEAGYRQANAAERFFAAPYYFGSQYLSEQIDSIDEYFEIYENPPTTTEQLIHGYEPGEEEPVPMTLNTTGLSGPEPMTVGRLGELTLRLSLFSELEETRAASAAAGWGNDTMIGVFDDDSPQDFSSLWTIKMDTQSDAEELRAAMEAYLDGRATEDAGIWFDEDDSVYLSLEHAGDRTVVLAIGSESFVGSITASSDGEEVSIGTEE